MEAGGDCLVDAGGEGVRKRSVAAHRDGALPRAFFYLIIILNTL
jgi:hypothetical protein